MVSRFQKDQGILFTHWTGLILRILL